MQQNLQPVSSGKQVHSSPTLSWRSWILPILLSFLPIFAGFWEVGHVEEFSEKREITRLQQATDPLAARLRKMTATDFWPGEFARRIRSHLESPRGQRLIATQGFSQALNRAIRNHGLRGMPDIQVWAAFPTASTPGQLEMCRGPEFESRKVVLFRSLLTEMWKERTTGDSDLPKWQNRLQTMFGQVITTSCFSGTYGGQAIPVLTSDGFGFIVWDFIGDGETGRPCGVFLAFVPSGLTDIGNGTARTIFNWRKTQVVPAFISFPLRFDATRPKLLLHPTLKDPDVTGFLSELYQRMRPTAPSDPQRNGLGSVWIPVSLEGRVFKRGSRWFRICSTAPECGTVGILVGRFDDRALLKPSWYLFRAGALIALVWLILFLRGISSGVWPDLSIMRSLLLWLFGLSAIPAVMGLLAGLTFVTNHEANLKDHLVRDMQSALSAIDAESTRLDREQEMKLYPLLQQASLSTTLRDLHLRKDEGGLSSFKGYIWKACEDMGLKMRSLTLTGFRGFFSYREQLGMQPSLTRSVLDLLRLPWERKLVQEPPEVTPILDAFEHRYPASAAGEPISRNLPGDETQFRPQKPTMARIISERFPRASFVSADFYKVSKVFLGKAYNASLVAPLIIGDTKWYFANLTWDQEHSFKQFFLQRFSALSSETGKRAMPFHIGFLHRDGNVLEKLFPTPFPPEIHRRVRDLGGRKSLMECMIGEVPSLLQIIPSQRVPGFIMVAWASLEPFQNQVRRETLFLLLVMVGSLLTMIVGALALARWLGMPLVRMTGGLVQISRGSLDIRVAEHRDDEIGDAGTVLDGMTNSLHERQLLTRFVAPQVLESVTGGDFQQALVPRRRHVAVLAMDIRNFTGLSEQIPPRDLFAGLNSHLQRMTTVIQSFGGVIDRFIGDAIVAIFYPLGATPPEYRAFAAAREMMQTHQRHFTEHAEDSGFQFGIGIGLDSGLALAGAIGDEAVRLDYSVLGEPIARAAHLEALSKKGRASRIVVSERFLELLPSTFRFLPIADEHGAWEFESTAGEGEARHPRERSLDIPSRVGASIPPHGKDPSEGKVPATQSKSADRMASPPRLDEPGPSRDASSLDLSLPFFWTVSLALVLAVMVQLVQTYREGEEQKFITRLTETAGILAGKLNPETTLTRDLRQVFTTPAETVSSESAREGLPAMVKYRMTALASETPGFQWALVEFPMVRARATLRFDGYQDGDRDESANPWRQTNVGMMASPLPLERNGRESSLTGGGFSFEISSDSFSLLHRNVGTRGSLVCRMLSLDSPSPFAQGGLVVRQSSDRGAPSFALLIGNDGICRFQRREKRGENATTVGIRTHLSFPLWLRLSWSHDRFAGDISSDGSAWEPVGSISGTLSHPLIGGIGVCSGISGTEVSASGARIIEAEGFSSEGLSRILNLGLVFRSDCNELLSPYGKILSPDFCRWRDTEFQQFLGEKVEAYSFFSTILNRAVLTNWRGSRAIRFFNFGCEPEFRQLRESVEKPLDLSTFHLPVQDQLLREYLTHVHERKWMFFFSYDPMGGWIEARAKKLAQELASQGIHLAFLGNGTLLPSGTDSPFAPKGALHGAIRQPISGLQRIGKALVLTASPFSLLDKQMIPLLAMDVPGPSMVAAVPAMGWIFLLLWVFGGLAWVMMNQKAAGFRAIQLRGRLTAAFLGILLPSFMVGYLIVERSGIEAKTRIRSEAPDTLQRHFEQAEVGHDLCISFVRVFLRNILDQSLFGMETTRQKKLELSDAEVRREGERILLKCIRHGIAAMRVIFTASGRDTTTINASTNVNDRQIADFWSLFSALTKVMMGRGGGEGLGPRSAKSDSKAFLFESESESIRDGCSIIFGGDEMLRALSRPEVWSLAFTGESNRFIWFSREYQKIPDHPTFVGIDLGSGYFETLLLQSVASIPAEFDDRNCGIQVLFGRFDPHPIVWPFLTFKSQGFRFDQPELMHAAWSECRETESIDWAANSREPTWESIGTGAQEVRSLAYPLSTYPAYTLLARLPLGWLLEQEDRRLQGNMLVLLSGLLAILFLSRVVAARFLGPVRELINACAHITRGDFSVRLVGGSGEFSLLAQAFNSMAREAQEGRLIGRFVSESVREIAQKRALDQSELEGRSCRAVVLFALRPDFKHLLETSIPEEVMVDLNRYLRSMSRIIRDHDGVIDKFIGEKILAVFHAGPKDDLSQAAQRALAAASAMRRETQALQDGSEGLQGIGMVAGPLLAGILGTPELRLEYTVIGDTVNLASRLADLAAGMPGGSILVDGGLASVAGDPVCSSGTHTLTALPSVKVKGKAREIEIYQLKEG